MTAELGPQGRGTWTPTPVELADLNHDQLQPLGAATVDELAAGLGQELAAVCTQIQGHGSQVLSAGGRPS